MLQAKIVAGVREILGNPGLRAMLLLGTLLSLSPGLANATLGDPAESVAADQKVFGGQFQTLGPEQLEGEQPGQSAASSSYKVEQISTLAGVIVNEYVSSSGTVFAVSWHGPRPPDLSQLLGSYYPQYQAAATAPHRQRGSLVVKTDQLVIETGGHMRDLHGRAYIPSLLPPDVSTEEIR
jgi:hypothetical protein